MKKAETPQKVLLDEMVRISDGAYLKYEFEDFFNILRQAIINKCLEGTPVGIESVVVFQPRVYNSKPRKSNMLDCMIPEGVSTTVKASITQAFKRNLKAEMKARKKQHEDQTESKET